MRVRKFTSWALLFVLLFTSLLLGVNPLATIAQTQGSSTSPIQVQRLGGLGRYDTSAEINKYGWQKASTYAVIATGEDFPDALSATPLAAKYNAPILLTEKTKLSDKSVEQLIRLKVSTVYIVGGTGVVSKAVEDQLTGMKITVKRLWGQDRYATSIEVAKMVGSQNGVVMATGANFPDALSIAPIAATKNMPILLTGKDNLPVNVKSYVTANGVSKAYIIGGAGVISDAILKQFSNGKRLAGQDRYKTNIAVLQEFHDELNLNTSLLATGENFPDALSGSALAPSTKSPIILVNRDINDSTKSFITTNYSSIQKLVVLGGEGAIPNSVVHSFTYDFLNNGSATVESNVKVIDQIKVPQVLQEIEKVEDTVGTDSSITLNTDTGTLGQLKPGDIFYLEPTQDNPTGYAEKVVSKSADSTGKTVLNVTQPQVNEVYSELKINLDKSLTPQDIIATNLPTGASLTLNGETIKASNLLSNSSSIQKNIYKPQSTQQIPDLSFNYNQLIPMGEGQNIAYKRTITLKQPKIVQDIDYDRLLGLNLPKLNRFNIGFSTILDDQENYSGNISQRVGATQIRKWIGQSNENKTLKLKGINMDDRVILFSATYGLGAVPTEFKIGQPDKSILLGLTMFFTLTLDGKLEVSLGLKTNSITQYNVGMKVQNYIPTLYDDKTVIQPKTTTLNLDGTVDANLGGGLALGVIAGGVVVGDVSINGILNFNAKAKGVSLTLNGQPPQGDEPITGSYGAKLDFRGEAGFGVGKISKGLSATATVNLYGPYELILKPFNEKDLSVAGIKLGMDEQSVKLNVGNPESRTEVYGDAVQENIITLTYPWGDVSLEHPGGQPTYVFWIDVKLPGLIGPRSTQVGDDMQSVMNKFRNDDYPAEYPNGLLLKPLYGKDYVYVDGHYWGSAYGDQSGNITDLNYGIDGPGYGGYGIDYQIDNGKVVGYSIGLGII